MSKQPKKSTKRPGIEFLLEIAGIIQEQLPTYGISLENAREVALKTVDCVRKKHGGTDVYIPKGMALTLSKRDWQIWQEFDGSNQQELAKTHKITTRQVYRIIERCREEENALNAQP